jgi:phosphatidylserine decarboxylase
MTQSVPGPFGQLTIGARAARTLVTEFARRPGPKTGLLVGATPGSAALSAAVDALLPDDTLIVLAAPEQDGPELPGTPPAPSTMAAHLAGLGGWVTGRVRVVDTLADTDPVDVVMVATPMTGTAEQARATLDALAKRLVTGGAVVCPVVALPGVAPGVAAELTRQAGLYGAGSDLVLRNLPPVRVHRLRWTPGGVGSAGGLGPAERTSSVPLTPSLHIDSNGVAAGALLLGMAVLTRLSRPGSRLWLLPAVAALPVTAFFRDPQRDPPGDESLAVAASDGTVMSVEQVSDDRFTGDGSTADYLRVAVFLSVLDVHVNRAPVAGQVVDHFLEDGGYAVAMTRDAEHNVSGYTVLQTRWGRVVVAQRTGLVARRIVHRAPVGTLLARGERFGLIRFGSRTDVYLPAAAAQPLVGPDERVRGGATPLARMR